MLRRRVRTVAGELKACKQSARFNAFERNKRQDEQNHYSDSRQEIAFPGEERCSHAKVA